MDFISVIIPVYNAQKTILQCLEALKACCTKNQLRYEAIIVDAGSSDDTLNLVKKSVDKVIVQAGVSRGVARNLGAQAASADFLVFLDSDCIVTPTWAKYLKEYSGSLNAKVLSGPCVLSEAKSAVGTAIRDLLSTSLLTSSSLTFCSLCSEQEVSDVPTSNLVLSNAFFKEINGFPDINYNEDNLFCKKVKDAGGKIFYSPKQLVKHERVFETAGDFGKYLFGYGEAYASSVKRYPAIINRYFFFALLFYPFIAVLVGISIINPSWALYIGAAILLGCLALLIYSFLKIRRSKSSVFIMPLFLLLLFAYCSGFIYGLLRSPSNVA